MYKPNFVLVGGVAKVLNQDVKDYVAEKQMSGDYSAIEDILMAQFASLTTDPKDISHGKPSYQNSQRAC